MAALEQADGARLHDLFREVFALRAALAGRMDEVHEQAGLRTPQARAADVLTRLGPVTVPDLAARLGVSRQFALTVCNELESLGLLEFADNPRHRRSRLAALTAEGRRVLARFREREAAFLGQVLPDLDPGAVDAARDLLRRIRNRVEADGSGQGPCACVAHRRTQGR